MATLVVSDLHGYPALLDNALLHANRSEQWDALVIAGDLIDRGTESRACIKRAESLGATVLSGNHELAIMLGFIIGDQDPQNRTLGSMLIERFMDPGIPNWGFVTCVEGVVVSHAGLSNVFQRDWDGFLAGDPFVLAEYVNEAVRHAIQRQLDTGEYDPKSVLGSLGPLWFRPGRMAQPLVGVTQVAGHTPANKGTSWKGFCMIDPGTYRGLGDPGRYSYALVESGEARVVAGTHSATG